MWASVWGVGGGREEGGREGGKGRSEKVVERKIDDTEDLSGRKNHNMNITTQYLGEVGLFYINDNNNKKQQH